jgi:O-antigen ligase
MAYISLIALLFSVTNFVPLSAIGFAPVLLCGWRFFDRRYPDYMPWLVVFGAYAALSTAVYDPASFLEFDFWRHDGNFFISYLPILAGCVYTHRWDLDKILRRFFIFGVLINVPYYAYYLAHNGLLSIIHHPADTFGSYFVARNAAGGFLAVLLCLGIACYSRQRSKWLLALMGLNLLMLFSTYSRGSLFGVVFLAPYLFFGRKRWMLATMVGALIAGSIAVALINTHPSTNYMGYSFTISNSDEKVANASIRYQWLWPRALAYFRQSPVFGLGFGSFDDQISDVVSYLGVFGHAIGISTEHTDQHAHNSYLNIMAELGIVGLVLILRFYWLLIRWCQRGAKAALAGGGSNVIAFRFVEFSSICLLAMSATEHRLTTPSNVLPIALGLSLLLASRAKASAPARARTVARRPGYPPPARTGGRPATPAPSPAPLAAGSGHPLLRQEDRFAQ